MEEVGHEDARRAEHREAAVHELRLLVPLQLGLVLAEAEGVEAVVAGQRAVEVVGQLGAGEPAGAVGDGGLLVAPALDPLAGLGLVGLVMRWRWFGVGGEWRF